MGCSGFNLLSSRLYRITSYNVCYTKLLRIIVGIVLGVSGVVGLLMGGLTTGFTLAVMLNNSGGAWDNAKKYIEKGHYGGKGSDTHKAGVRNNFV